MKKLIFLLIMAIFLVGIMPGTEIARPPWAQTQSIVLP